MTKAEIIEKVKDLIAAPSCCAPLKALAEEWLKAEGTANEKEMSKKLIAELEKDVQKAADCLRFFDSEAGRKAMGEEFAAKMAKHFKELVDAGEIWCDCPACTPGRAILENKEVIL
ncbi:MAG: heat-shock protein Hsp90 [Schwartzia sp.]|nr:heat-shock protein Hsp90 [Schwartzia sp. (in: firmicutes)]